MAHPAAPTLLRRVGDHWAVPWLVRASSVRAGLAQGARIVLLASARRRNAEIADRVDSRRVARGCPTTPGTPPNAC
jgi:hypothetical protein